MPLISAIQLYNFITVDRKVGEGNKLIYERVQNQYFRKINAPAICSIGVCGIFVMPGFRLLFQTAV